MPELRVYPCNVCGLLSPRPRCARHSAVGPVIVNCPYHHRRWRDPDSGACEHPDHDAWRRRSSHV